MKKTRLFGLAVFVLFIVYCVMIMTLLEGTVVGEFTPEEGWLLRPLLFALFAIHAGWGIFAGTISHYRGYKAAGKESWRITNIAGLIALHGMFAGPSILITGLFLERGEFFPKVEYGDTFSLET